MIKKVNDSNEDYHSHKFLGTSAIVSGYHSKTGEVNLAKIKAYLDGLGEISSQTQKIFDFGSVQHAVVLEQDLREVVVLPDFKPIQGLTIKAQKEQWILDNPDEPIKNCPKFSAKPGITAKAQIDAFKEQNKATYYINEKEFHLIESAFNVISSHSEAAQMISNALDIETSFYDESTGLKCRPDIVGETDEGHLYVCNYKTIADLDKCDSHIFSLKYDLRAIQELLIVEKAYNRKVDHYLFLFQEKKPPFSVRCIEISDLDMEFALKEYERIKNLVLLSIKEQYFPQPVFRIEQSKIYRSPQMEMF